MDERILPVTSTQPTAFEGEREIVQVGHTRSEFSSAETTTTPFLLRSMYSTLLAGPDTHQVVGRALVLGSDHLIPILPLDNAIHRSVSVPPAFPLRTSPFNLGLQC